MVHTCHFPYSDLIFLLAFQDLFLESLLLYFCKLFIGEDLIKNFILTSVPQGRLQV